MNKKRVKVQSNELFVMWNEAEFAKLRFSWFNDQNSRRFVAPILLSNDRYITLCEQGIVRIVTEETKILKVWFPNWENEN